MKITQYFNKGTIIETKSGEMFYLINLRHLSDGLIV